MDNHRNPGQSVPMWESYQTRHLSKTVDCKQRNTNRATEKDMLSVPTSPTTAEKVSYKQTKKMDFDHGSSVASYSFKLSARQKLKQKHQKHNISGLLDSLRSSEISEYQDCLTDLECMKKPAHYSTDDSDYANKYVNAADNIELGSNTSKTTFIIKKRAKYFDSKYIDGLENSSFEEAEENKTKTYSMVESENNSTYTCDGESSWETIQAITDYSDIETDLDIEITDSSSRSSSKKIGSNQFYINCDTDSDEQQLQYDILSKISEAMSAEMLPYLNNNELVIRREQLRTLSGRTYTIANSDKSIDVNKMIKNTETEVVVPYLNIKQHDKSRKHQKPLSSRTYIIGKSNKPMDVNDIVKNTEAEEVVSHSNTNEHGIKKENPKPLSGRTYIVGKSKNPIDMNEKAKSTEAEEIVPYLNICEHNNRGENPNPLSNRTYKIEKSIKPVYVNEEHKNIETEEVVPYFNTNKHGMRKENPKPLSSRTYKIEKSNKQMDMNEKNISIEAEELVSHFNINEHGTPRESSNPISSRTYLIKESNEPMVKSTDLTLKDKRDVADSLDSDEKSIKTLISSGTYVIQKHAEVVNIANDNAGYIYFDKTKETIINDMYSQISNMAQSNYAQLDQTQSYKQKCNQVHNKLCSRNAATQTACDELSGNTDKLASYNHKKYRRMLEVSTSQQKESSLNLKHKIATGNSDEARNNTRDKATPWNKFERTTDCCAEHQKTYITNSPNPDEPKLKNIYTKNKEHLLRDIDSQKEECDLVLSKADISSAAAILYTKYNQIKDYLPDAVECKKMNTPKDLRILIDKIRARYDASIGRTRLRNSKLAPNHEKRREKCCAKDIKSLIKDKIKAEECSKNRERNLGLRTALISDCLPKAVECKNIENSSLVLCNVPVIGRVNTTIAKHVRDEKRCGESGCVNLTKDERKNTLQGAHFCNASELPPNVNVTKECAQKVAPELMSTKSRTNYYDKDHGLVTRLDVAEEHEYGLKSTGTEISSKVKKEQSSGKSTAAYMPCIVQNHKTTEKSCGPIAATVADKRISESTDFLKEETGFAHAAIDARGSQFDCTQNYNPITDGLPIVTDYTKVKNVTNFDILSNRAEHDMKHPKKNANNIVYTSDIEDELTKEVAAIVRNVNARKDVYAKELRSNPERVSNNLPNIVSDKVFAAETDFVRYLANIRKYGTDVNIMTDSPRVVKGVDEEPAVGNDLSKVDYHLPHYKQTADSLSDLSKDNFLSSIVDTVNVSAENSIDLSDPNVSLTVIRKYLGIDNVKSLFSLNSTITKSEADSGGLLAKKSTNLQKALLEDIVRKTYSSEIVNLGKNSIVLMSNEKFEKLDLGSQQFGPQQCAVEDINERVSILEDNKQDCFSMLANISSDEEDFFNFSKLDSKQLGIVDSDDMNYEKIIQDIEKLSARITKKLMSMCKTGRMRKDVYERAIHISSIFKEKQQLESTETVQTHNPQSRLHQQQGSDKQSERSASKPKVQRKVHRSSHKVPHHKRNKNERIGSKEQMANISKIYHSLYENNVRCKQLYGEYEAKIAKNAKKPLSSYDKIKEIKLDINQADLSVVEQQKSNEVAMLKKDVSMDKKTQLYSDVPQTLTDPINNNANAEPTGRCSCLNKICIMKPEYAEYITIKPTFVGGHKYKSVATQSDA